MWSSVSPLCSHISPPPKPGCASSCESVSDVSLELGPAVNRGQVVYVR